LKAGAWLRRVRFVIVSPDLRHNRRCQAEIPLIAVFEFGQPPLFDVTKCATQEAIIGLGAAFRAFFEKREHNQRFKKRGVRESFCAANEAGSFRVEGRRIKLPVIGWVRMREAIRVAGRLKRVTVSCEADRWFASIMVETGGIWPPEQPLLAVGVDLGVTTLATLSTGEAIQGPKPDAALLMRLRGANRALSRKKRSSRNAPAPGAAWRSYTPAFPISAVTSPIRPRRCWRRPFAALGSNI